MDVGVAVKAARESRFHENRDLKRGELCFQCTDRACEQQAITHRAQTYEKNPRTGTKRVKQIFSLQPWLRSRALPECHRVPDRRDDTDDTLALSPLERRPQVPYRAGRQES